MAWRTCWAWISLSITGTETPRIGQRMAQGGQFIYLEIEPAVEPPPPQMAYSFPNHYWRLPKNHEDLIASIRWAARDRLSAEVKAPEWVTMELARQEKGPLLLHLVNYKSKETVRDIRRDHTPAREVSRQGSRSGDAGDMSLGKV